MEYKDSEKPARYSSETVKVYEDSITITFGGVSKSNSIQGWFNLVADEAVLRADRDSELNTIAYLLKRAGSKALVSYLNEITSDDEGYSSYWQETALRLLEKLK